MAVEHERAFEDEVCAHLAAHGWLYSENDAGYDKARALFPEDVIAWLRETQPDELAKAPDEAQLLGRLVKTLDLPLDAGGGTLNVLRHGFKKTPARFAMCQFRPNTTQNESAMARYAAVRLRVMRQVRYSQKFANSIDLVLFVNGLPVATIELKTDNVQSIGDAIAQYRHDRDPRGEPLLGFGNRCLVHFAVSDDEVAMTTRLAGSATHFLPFNTGYGGGAGNPPNPRGSATAYLWERVLQRDAWLHVIGKLLHVETRTDIDPITGEASKRTTLLFPRYHQWELVTSLLSTVREEGPGHRYLVMHSAGSGKTNSISWTAHGLSSLHDEHNQKVFDSVIVVTDRTVLDDQLQKAIKQIEGVDGTVAMINPDEVRNAGDDVKSKSALLARELVAGRHVVIVTMQTFPYALTAIREHKGLAGKRFAIIADEAHSSQTGRTSQQLRAALTADEQRDLDDGGEIDVEAMLTAEMEGRATSPNLSFFAFTATPKNKTLALFGRKDDDGQPRPFHVYTMQQAIEEGYILDVLRSYTTYDTAFQIAEKSRKHLEDVSQGKPVDESEATKGLMRWVSLHPTNIAQKVQIIVEHYRANVRHLLDGHAKAMVVTSSREHAVRYKEAIDAYIAKRGYDLASLVAFSGSIEVDGVAFAVEPPYTEANLNAGLRGRGLPVALGSDDFQVLIVANKYQTGFDQPLLCAMYVDKRLSGVTAVQTLSRLNRTYAAGGKDTTYVLDFVNDPAEILDSFKPYYREASLEGTTDPDIVHDLQAKLDAADIYTAGEVEAFTTAYLVDERHGAIDAPLKTAAGRFNSRYAAAVQAGDKTAVEELDLFRKDVGSFVRLYDFLSQIIDYADTDLEKRSLFLRLLARRLTGRVGAEAVDFSAVELTHIKQARSGDHELDLSTGDLVQLRPVTASGSGVAHDPRMVCLAEVLEKLNDLFAGEDFTVAQQQSWAESIVTVLEADATIQAQAHANREQQFVESQDLSNKVTEAVINNQATHSRMADYFFTDDRLQAEVVRALGRLVYENLRAGAS
jgi:type I restriction enzyme R subunit